MPNLRPDLLAFVGYQGSNKCREDLAELPALSRERTAVTGRDEKPTSAVSSTGSPPEPHEGTGGGGFNRSQEGPRPA
jgi:hypothetical protein